MVLGDTCLEVVLLLNILFVAGKDKIDVVLGSNGSKVVFVSGKNLLVLDIGKIGLVLGKY